MIERSINYIIYYLQNSENEVIISSFGITTVGLCFSAKYLYKPNLHTDLTIATMANHNTGEDLF
jgi:hypothetical protein